MIAVKKTPWPKHLGEERTYFTWAYSLSSREVRAEAQSRNLKIGTEVEWSLHINEENALPTSQ